MVHMTGDRFEVLAIPPGVAHGVYSRQGSTLLVGVSGYYDPADHRRCLWNCPELDLDWPCHAPELSEADRQAPGYAELKSALLAAMASLPKG
jgi:dTDP-4-dehydrorhamnose 3,5-epimerase